MRSLPIMLALWFLVEVASAQGPNAIWRGRRIWRADTDPSRLLATPPPEATPWHHTRIAPEVGNGRLWSTRVFTREPRAIAPRRGRGPGAFGAPAGAPGLVFAKIGTEVLAFEAWEMFGTEGFGTLDAARAAWLEEQGYTGGVRTFVNPSRASERELPSEEIEPAGWFRRPAVLPRTRPVESVRFSVPPGMDPRLAAALGRSVSQTRTAER
jgi:hypothetical protein